MTPLEQVEGYDPAFNRSKRGLQKFKPTKANYNFLIVFFRTFLRNAFKGDFEGIWYNETRRTHDTEGGRLLGKLIRGARHSKWNEEFLKILKEETLSAEECKKQEGFDKKKMVLTALHYFSEMNPERDNADTMNTQELLKFCGDKGGIIKLSAVNVPPSYSEKKPSSFQVVMHNTIYLAIGCPLILTNNINSSVGLFNGAECTFQGLIYREDNPLDLIVRYADLAAMKLDSNFCTTRQIQKYPHSNGQPVVYEKGIRLVKLNGDVPTQQALDDLKKDNVVEIEAQFQIPSEPPFVQNARVVLKVPGYIGPPIFPDDDSKRHFVIIDPHREFSHPKGNKKQPKQGRIQIPAELAWVMSAFAKHMNLGKLC